jgi:uncharacterized membrane protein
MNRIAMPLTWVAVAGGFAAAAAALYGRNHTLPAFLTGPVICQLRDNGCEALFRTPLAALLGVPNSALAMLFYLFVSMGLLLRWPTELLLGAATVALAMSVYLAYRLVRDRLECRICWTGHAANALLWMLLAARLPGETR